MDTLGLYIHIPFCARKCYYCDFTSYPDKLEEADTYIKAVLSEARIYEAYINKHIVNTVFIGGGTPSILSSAQINKLIYGLRNFINIDTEEFTIEANPETVDEDKIKSYADAGINRISLGLQSHDNKILKSIGRRHTFEDFIRAYKIAQKYIGNINVDTIFGLPGQTVENYSDTIKHLLELAPQHISCYSLKLEEGTKLYSAFSGADDETDRQMYHEAVETLTQIGYVHYETSNFALPGFECKHNLKYWKGGEYLGLGVAAGSYDLQSRHTNTARLSEYIDAAAKGVCPSAEVTELSLHEKEQEYIMLHLRLEDGISFENYSERFDEDFSTKYKDAVISALKEGLVTADSKGIYPTLKGFDLQNNLILKFMKNM